MTLTTAYVVIPGLAIGAAGLGSRVCQDRQTQTHLKIDIGKSGLSIQLQ